MAWFDEAQAEDTENAGPVRPSSIDMWLAAAECGQEIRCVTDGWIGGDAGEAVGAAALDTDDEITQRAGFAHLLAGFCDRGKGGADGAGHHVALGCALLLLEDVERFVEARIQTVERILQQAHLRVLTAETENGGTRDI